MKRLVIFAPAVVMLAIAGCGGSSSSSKTTSNVKPSSNTTSASAATLAVGSTGLGKVLVGTNSRTLYLFEKDKGPTSTCSGACAANWPPFTTTGTPKAGASVDAAKLTTSKRSDGKMQVVYAGHPLYFYTGDAKSGDTNGQGQKAFGAEWYVLDSTGTKVEKKSSSSTGSSSSSGTSTGSSSSSGGGYYH
jgi:predicted lipoprotein with Yx(FWY)xxD motif